MARDSYAAWRRTHARVRRKVSAIIRDGFGECGEGMCSGRSMLPATQAITRAFATDMSTETAAEVGIYMADWGEEVATMAAIHLFPERFTAKEIQVAIEYVLVKIPYDVAWAAHLLGEPIEACFLSQLKAQPATRRKRSPKRKPTKRLG